jgi:DNA-binding NarL/FixJ family response regulator
VEKYQPDLLLIEPFLGHHDRIFLIKELAGRFPRTRILVISKQPEQIYAERALRAGASGYWMKTRTREELIRAIDTVLAGELYVSPAVALLAIHKLTDHPPAHPRAADLTDRELHVLALKRRRLWHQSDRTRTRDQPENRGNLLRTYQAKAGIPRR